MKEDEEGGGREARCVWGRDDVRIERLFDAPSQGIPTLTLTLIITHTLTLLLTLRPKSNHLFDARRLSRPDKAAHILP